MQPPAPFPPGPAAASPAAVAAALARHLAGHGLTGIYTAATAKYAVISVTAGLTVWTNGHQLWCTHHGQHHTWPAADLAAAADRIAALAAPDRNPLPVTGRNHDDALTDTAATRRPPRHQPRTRPRP